MADFVKEDYLLALKTLENASFYQTKIWAWSWKGWPAQVVQARVGDLTCKVYDSPLYGTLIKAGEDNTSAGRGFNFLNNAFVKWAASNIDVDDELYHYNSCLYSYIDFLEAGRYKEVIQAWQSAYDNYRK